MPDFNELIEPRETGDEPSAEEVARRVAELTAKLEELPAEAAAAALVALQRKANAGVASLSTATDGAQR